MKKKKVRHEKKRFTTDVVAFKHEKRLRAWIEFTGVKGRKKRESMTEEEKKEYKMKMKAMKDSYHEN